MAERGTAPVALTGRLFANRQAGDRRCYCSSRSRYSGSTNDCRTALRVAAVVATRMAMATAAR